MSGAHELLSECELADMRTLLDGALPDECRITSAGALTLNLTTGVAASSEVAVWSGACRLRSFGSTTQRQVIIGEQFDVLGRYIATIPLAGTSAVDSGQFLTITASSSDAAIIGKSFRIIEVHEGSWQMNRQLVVERLQPDL